MIFSHSFTPHASTLWNNRTVLISRKTVFQHDWFNRKFYMLKTLNDEGKLLTCASFTNKYQLSCTLRDFNRICRAIPSALIHLISNSLLISHNVVISLPKLQTAELNVSDFKLTNKSLNNCFKERIYHVHNRVSFRLFSHLESQNTLVKAQSMWNGRSCLKSKKFILKLLTRSVSEFLKYRFKFDVDLLFLWLKWWNSGTLIFFPAVFLRIFGLK